MSSINDKPPRIKWRLVGRVLRYIKNHPDRYEQNTWLEYEGETQYSERLGEEIPVKQPTMCNTKGCFAGWCVMLTSTTKEWRRLLRDVVMDYAYHINYVEETAKRCGFTHVEADYLTDGADGTPQENYETIRNRICAIVRSRSTGEHLSEAEEYIKEHGRGAVRRHRVEQKSQAA